jgi:uncharacterized protein (TIGR03437 family)
VRFRQVFFLFCLCFPSEPFVSAQNITGAASQSTLVAGGGAQTIELSSPTALQAIPFSATWNGAAVPVTVENGSVPYGIEFKVSLTADQLANSQLGTLAIFDARSSTVIESASIPVVFPVSAVGVFYDAARGRLYLTTGDSTSSASPAPANPADPRFPTDSLISIDVSAGNATKAVSLGAAGLAMAMSDDGKTLYLAVLPNIIRRIDPDSFQAMGDFTLAPIPQSTGGNFTPRIADLAVMPGAPNTLAIRYDAGPGTGTQVGIFDSGMQRANMFGGSIAAYQGIPGLVFSPDGAYLFAGNGEPNSMYRLAIDSSGTTKQTAVTAPGGPPLTIIGDTLYARNGISVDWRTLEATGNLDGPATETIDSDDARIIAAFATPQYSPTPSLLQAFDLATQTPFGTLPFPLTPVNLFHFAPDGMIVQTASSILFFHTPLAGPAPAIASGGVLSAASFAAGPVAPGEIVSIFGSGLGPSPGQSFTLDGNRTVNPAGMQVWFGNRQGTILFASPGQMNAVAPFEIEPGSTVPLQIWNNGIPSAQTPVTIATATPALLTRDASGKGLVAMVNQDGRINAPASRGSIVSLYGTGGGFFPGASDGSIAAAANALNASVQVSIGGQPANATYAGAAPELVDSVFQLNVRIPDNLTPGTSVPVIVTIGGNSSPEGVTVEIQ